MRPVLHETRCKRARCCIRGSRRQALATGLIGFADELGAAIIAEGIETQAELETLRNLGVRYGQGYFLGNPGPLPQ